MVAFLANIIVGNTGYIPGPNTFVQSTTVGRLEPTLIGSTTKSKDFTIAEDISGIYTILDALFGIVCAKGNRSGGHRTAGNHQAYHLLDKSEQLFVRHFHKN